MDAITLRNLFAKLVEYIGPTNEVHDVTNNPSNDKAIGRLLNGKYPNVYLSPCAAHYLDLVLGDIVKMKLVTSIEKVHC